MERPREQLFSQWQSVPLTAWKGILMKTVEEHLYISIDILSCPRWHRDIPWIYTEADSSLYDSCHLLKKYAIHKLPVLSVEDNLVIHILTHSRILSFVHQQLGYTDRELEALFSVSINELHIGTMDNVYTIGLNQDLQSILTLFHDKNVSAVPIVDQNGKYCSRGRKVEI